MKKNKKNEEMMFLGVDGFSEIENLMPEKETVVEKQTAEFIPERVNAVKWKETALKLRNRLKNSNAFKASKNKAQPAHIKGGAREHKVYKKRAVLAVAASVTAAMLSFATVASALDGGEKPEQTVAATTPATMDELIIPHVKNLPASEIGVSALYIDGECVGVVEDGAKLHEALNNILAAAKEGYDDSTTTEFANNVEVKPYEGDKTPVSVDELMEETQYMYSIKMETDWIYEAETEYETDVTYDDSLPSDYEEITQEGQNGVTEVTIRLSFVDGVQTDAVVTGEKVISEIVNEKKTVGTSESSSKSESSDNSESSESSGNSEKHTGDSGASTGGFIWPVPHTHNVTSLMEWRWGRMHNGIDIAGGGDYGQPFIAADGGTVIWSGNDGGGYGNYVMIDHGNGYMTVYGHASELACSTGDYVSQGDVIGYIGSTGNSTGPHLHFEIRLNGDYQDPLGYVS